MTTKKMKLPEGSIFDVGNKEIANNSKEIENKNIDKINKNKSEITVSESESTSASTQNESKKNTESKQSASVFKIKKGSRSARRTTVTYRINTETIDKIEDLAGAARKSINETVQELLDLALEHVEVE